MSSREGSVKMIQGWRPRLRDASGFPTKPQMLTIGEGSSEVCQIVISGKLYHTDLTEY